MRGFLNPFGIDAVGGYFTQDSAAKRVAILGCTQIPLRGKDTRRHPKLCPEQRRGGLRATTPSG